MRLVSYTLKGDSLKGVHLGLLIPTANHVLDISGVLGLPPTLNMRQFLELGEDARKLLKSAATREENQAHAVSMSALSLTAPINNSDKVICIGMNYEDHCIEQNMAVPTEPVVFSKFASCISGPFDDIEYEGPTQTKELDFEVEMVIVIGKEGRAISREDAMGHVVGYTVAHDISARDWQFKRNGGQWLMGKAMDGFAPIGPAIVTLDEIGDPHNLGIRCFLNGKSVQDSNTRQLVFKTEELVEWVSRYNTLKPGDLILTGTPPGVGCFRKPQLFLKHGDVVTCEIDNIGSITNKIVQVPLKHKVLTAGL